MTKHGSCHSQEYSITYDNRFNKINKQYFTYMLPDDIARDLKETFCPLLWQVVEVHIDTLQFFLFALVLFSQVCGKTSQLLVQNSKQIIKKSVFSNM